MQIAQVKSKEQGKVRRIAGRRHQRDRLARVVGRVDSAYDGRADRAAARQEGLPRTTMRYHQQRRQRISAAREEISFFESEIGIGFLHRLLTALHYVFSFVGAAGTRLIALFLRLAKLDAFVAASRESQRQVARAVQSALCDFGEEQSQALAAAMQAKDISVAQDETFHPQICLVAMEPVSGYILLEKYADRRDAETWNEAMNEALRGLPVKVIQSTGDEAKGIRAHVEQSLGAHHSPDLFHVQHETARSMSAPLAANVRRAEKAATDATAAVAQQCDQAHQYHQERHGPGRPPDFEVRVAAAMEEESHARDASKEAQQLQELARQARRSLGEHYHLVDIGTGAWRTPQAVERALKAEFAALRQIATKADLPERAFNSIDKAERVLPDLIATLTFVNAEIKRRVAELPVGQDAQTYVHDTLIPQAYLRRAASKAATAKKRRAILSVVASMARPVPQQLQQLPESDRQGMECAVNDCAELFQRASSCVEGRNGQLALRHHSLHNLPPQRLKALTVVHNFGIQRADGTTAASRFFGAKHPGLFTWIVERLPLPARPRRTTPTLN